MRCSAKKFAKCKLDSVGFVQSECYEITDPKRINRQKKALKLVEYVIEISNITQAERALKSAQEDDELIPIAPAAIAKLLNHERQDGLVQVDSEGDPVLVAYD